MQLIETLNKNAGAAQVILSFLLIAATAIYVWFTRQMWAEMRESNRRLAEPVVYAGFEQGRVFRAIYDLVVRNDGPTDAFKIKVSISRYNLDDKEKLGELGVIKQGLPVLAVRQEFRTIAFDMRTVVSRGNHKAPLSVHVQYEDSQGNPFRRDYHFDLAVLSEQSYLVGQDLDSIGRELKDMQDDTRAIRDGVKDLREGIDYAVASIPRRKNFPADPLAALTALRNLWVDHRSQESGIQWVGYVMYRLRLVSRSLYESLAESTNTDHVAIRRLLLKMGEQRFYLDGGRSRDTFVGMGDRVVSIICKLDGTPNVLEQIEPDEGTGQVP